jgi:acyl carrier protein
MSGGARRCLPAGAAIQRDAMRGRTQAPGGKMNYVYDKVVSLIAQKANCDPAELNRDTAIQDIKIDSLDVVEIFFEIEETFDISIPYNANDEKLAESANFRTIGNVVDTVSKIVDETKVKNP